MNHLFPPLLPKEALQPPVLVLAAHPDDEVIALGGMLAFHCDRGDPVTVAHFTTGSAGDPDGRFEDIAATRRNEAKEALAKLGAMGIRSYDFPDGKLHEHADAAAEQVRKLYEELQPKTLYSFFFTEAHSDHRTLARAAVQAADALPRGCRCLLYGVNQVVVGGTLFETGAYMERKKQALEAFASQTVYNNFIVKVLHRDHAASVNVEDPAIQHTELFADLTPDRLQQALDLADPLYRFLVKE